MNSTSRTLIAAAFSLAASLAAPHAHAYTTCAGLTVTTIVTDIGLTSGAEHSYVATSGAGFDVTTAMLAYGSAMSIATQAKLLGGPVTLIFSANGVNCATATYRTDLLQISVGS